MSMTSLEIGEGLAILITYTYVAGAVSWGVEHIKHDTVSDMIDKPCISTI